MCSTRENGAVPPYGPRPSSAASGPTRRAELDRLLETGTTAAVNGGTAMD
ncbi:hypothetical protein ABT215_31010 [Streptomyces sp900105755]